MHCQAPFALAGRNSSICRATIHSLFNRAGVLGQTRLTRDLAVSSCADHGGIFSHHLARWSFFRLLPTNIFRFEPTLVTIFGSFKQPTGGTERGISIMNKTKD